MRPDSAFRLAALQTSLGALVPDAATNRACASPSGWCLADCRNVVPSNDLCRQCFAGLDLVMQMGFELGL